MVKEVTAYEASDRSLHLTKLAAAKHDAVMALVALQTGDAGKERGIFNHGTAISMVEHYDRILPLLQQIADATPTEE